MKRFQIEKSTPQIEKSHMSENDDVFRVRDFGNHFVRIEKGAILATSGSKVRRDSYKCRNENK